MRTWLMIKTWVLVSRCGDGEAVAGAGPGAGHKEMLRRVAAHRHGEDFDADIDNEYSYKMGAWVCEDSVGMLAASTDGRVCEQSEGNNREGRLRRLPDVGMAYTTIASNPLCSVLLVTTNTTTVSCGRSLLRPFFFLLAGDYCGCCHVHVHRVRATEASG